MRLRSPIRGCRCCTGWTGRRTHPSGRSRSRDTCARVRSEWATRRLNRCSWISTVTRCWSDRKQSYTQAAESEDRDASVLLGAKFGYGDPAGTRYSRTIDALRRELGRGPFLYRYMSDDDLRGEEGTFLCCSFWLAEVL